MQHACQYTSERCSTTSTNAIGTSWLNAAITKLSYMYTKLIGLLVIITIIIVTTILSTKVLIIHTHRDWSLSKLRKTGISSPRRTCSEQEDATLTKHSMQAFRTPQTPSSHKDVNLGTYNYTTLYHVKTLTYTQTSKLHFAHVRTTSWSSLPRHNLLHHRTWNTHSIRC